LDCSEPSKSKSGGNFIDNRTDSFEVGWHPYVVDILGELVCRPFPFAILASEVERFDGVAVEGGLLSVDHRIMTVESLKSSTIPLTARAML
jgi:hypothetical protein